MSLFMRLCFSLALLAPSLVHAATLENPGNGSFYSGIGVVSGWKCWANGPLTVRFNGGGGLCGQNPFEVCIDIWTGPDDGSAVQQKAICQSACNYATACHDEGVRVNCDNLRRLDELNNTNANISNCPVCP